MQNEHDIPEQNRIPPDLGAPGDCDVLLDETDPNRPRTIITPESMSADIFMSVQGAFRYLAMHVSHETARKITKVVKQYGPSDIITGLRLLLQENNNRKGNHS